MSEKVVNWKSYLSPAEKKSFLARALARYDLQYKLIYSVIVAGKSATFTDAVMKRLFPYGVFMLPFYKILKWSEAGELEKELRAARTGNYTKLVKCLPALIQLNPLCCTIDELEAVHGVGPKTSRFFILWTRPGAQHAALDTHILKWLRSLGYDAPKSTPQAKKKYRELEKIFLDEARTREMEPRDLDYKIWAEYSGYKE